MIRTQLMERAIFRGESAQSERDRAALIDQAAKNPLIEKPEDVAQAIWRAVDQQEAEIVVGSAKLAKGAYQVFPGLMQSLFRRLFGLEERHA